MNANRLFNNDYLNYQNHQKYFSVAFDRNGTFISQNKQLTLGTYELYVYDKNNVLIGLYDFKSLNNRVLVSNETTVYFNYDTINPLTIEYHTVNVDIYHSSNSGITIRGTLGDLESGDNKASTDQTKIVTKNEALKALLLEGHKVYIQRKNQGINLDYNVIDADILIIDNGLIRSFTDIGGQSESNTTSRHPRTGFGFKDDGSMVLFTVDGRQASAPLGIASSGVNLREFAEIMRANDIVKGYNLDGGGSTQFVLRENNELKVVNSPSEGPN